MGEVKPRILPNGAVYYPNPIARALLAFLPVPIFIGTLVALPYFLHVFKPIALVYIGIPLTVIVSLFILLNLDRGLVLSLEIGRGYVIIKHIFRKIRITPSDVIKITFDPPIYSDSLEYRYWGVSDSVCWVEFRDGKKKPFSFMPNGIKLRMARVLDPQNFPVAA